MKKFILYIVGISCFFNLFSAQAAEKNNVILQLDDRPEPRELTREELSAVKQFESALFRYKHFYDKYPGDAIFGDITDDVAKMYPHLNQEEVEKKADDIQTAIKYYRYFEGLYERAKEYYLTPKAPPLIVDEDEYDEKDTTPYIASSTEAVVINDFKKVVPYGMNPRDFEAIEQLAIKKMRARSETLDKFYRFGELLGKLEWRKLFFYGLVYDDPFTGRRGMGDWTEKQDWGEIRLLSQDPDVSQRNIQAAVHVKLNSGYGILVSPERGWNDPEFDFSASKNLASAQVLFPLPKRIANNERDNIYGYGGNFSFPLQIEVEDETKPLDLRAKISFSVCRKDQCSLVTAEPELSMLPGEKDINSAVGNFITRSFNELPKPQLNDLQIVKVVADEAYGENENPVLRIVLKTAYAPKKIDIFLKSEDGLSFYSPKVSINGSDVTARFESRNKEVDLSGRKFEVTAAISDMESLRTEVLSRKASLFDIERPTLTLGLLFLAVVGGFILNFMPCVFPVLSLKFLSLTQFGGQNRGHIRRGFAFTVVGIFIAFAILSGMLLILKYIGVSVGWGMQFQNPYFIVSVMFVMLLFIAQIFGWITIQTPSFVMKWLNRPAYSDNFLNILTGLFLVLVATPCTAPYLGTTLGFALAGTYSDILAIMTAVALGLSLPYVFLSVYPDVGLLMPKPGPWMNKINNLMVFMLFLTLAWLGSVLYAQTDKNVIITLALTQILFLVLLYFRRKIIDGIEVQNETAEVRKRAMRLVKFLALLLAAGLLWYNYHKTAEGFARHQSEVAVTRRLKLDKNEIDSYLKKGNIIIVKVGADWCLTCKFNNFTVFDNITISSALAYHKVKIIEVDWTNYDKEVLEFMKKFGRSGLPFYVIFSRSIPDGMVLPEVLTDADLISIIRGMDT